MENKARLEFETYYPLPDDGCYFNGISYQGGELWWLQQALYDCWEVSREALVVELPKTISHCNMGINGYVNPSAESYDEAIEDCQDALREYGISFK